MYKCNPINTYLTTSVEVNDLGLVLTVDELNLSTITNLTKFNVRICQCIPSTACTQQVWLSDGCTTLMLLLTVGNVVRADQLKPRTVYPMIYGDDTSAHVSLLCKVPCSKYTPSVVSKVATTAAKTSTKGA